MFLARVLGVLYFVNNVDDAEIRGRSKKALLVNTVLFLVFFLTYFVHVMVKDGYAVDPDTQIISIEPLKYFHNITGQWYLLVIFLIGVVAVLWGIIQTWLKVDKEKPYTKGIWFAGAGVVLVVLAFLLTAGWGNTAYYPSTADLQSSLTLQNSCSSEFTLRTMAWVSLFVPFVLAYIWYAWRSMDKKKIDRKEVEGEEHMY